jgi:hypothetical protein
LVSERKLRKIERAEAKYAKGKISTDKVIKAGDKFTKALQKTCPHTGSKSTEHGVTTCDDCGAQC